MWYRSIRTGALFLLFILFVLLSYSIKQVPQPVMSTNDAYLSIEALSKSIGAINTIEYKLFIKAAGHDNKKGPVEMHYYYKKPFRLRSEYKNGSSITIDIYTPSGMYEYFPQSHIAYYREKWEDEKPVTFQLKDKLEDITIRGKYEVFRMDRIGNMDVEIIRSVDDDGGKIFEHRVWIASIEGFSLPLKEEYLIDGELGSVHEYQYISINKNIPDSYFELKQDDGLKIHNAEGIPKMVKDEAEAERFVKFDILMPDYIPKNFALHEIIIVPPVKSPSVLISYISDMDTIYLNQKKTGRSELTVTEADNIISAGGRKFAVRRLLNNLVCARWVKDGIEFEVAGVYTLKSEIIKIIHDISGIWISI